MVQDKGPFTLKAHSYWAKVNVKEKKEKMSNIKENFSFYFRFRSV